ncbi:hypothetical protein [Bacillus sp. 95MFCvi2.1]|uniref:hypothetical protein n=1 Tax=Bacillus sp. 95MFCvi2.1 TaxID=1151121 RepID=UPI00037B59C0|nr:hypothetical protein [Bacillus sp. 95MFCvi2.1]
MNKKGVRLQIINLQDQHCRACEHRYDRDMEYCWTKCEIGMRLNELGIVLGGKKGTDKKKIRTKEDWDNICKKAVAMRAKGLTYVRIAEIFNVKEPCQIRLQLQKRGLHK